MVTKRALAFASVPFFFAAACGGGRVPAISSDRSSGQSGLMDKTVAGSAKCNTKNHNRPFVIEWDATDMSQFEALTRNDVVFVRYQGCELTVIDSCKDDSVKGALGSYKPVDWTSGSVEKIDITNEGELYAKLPLGVASLDARVSAGESFLMEYFVAGTRTATRPVQYRPDLAKIPGCAGVTHFVYSYNLGAFQLRSGKKIEGEGGVNVVVANAGGNSKYASSAEKKGGLLSSCRGENAQEIESCKTPIRLTLREIDIAESPVAVSARAPETPDALNLAAKVEAEAKLNAKAKEHMRTAMEKINAGDGRGCLTALDAFDRAVDAHEQSTNAKSPFSHTRARCIMAAGQCDAGKDLARRYFEGVGGKMSPQTIDLQVDYEASRTCQGKMSPRDRFLKVNGELQDGAYRNAMNTAFCMDHYKEVKTLSSTVQPRAEDDALMISAKAMDPERLASQCLARAHECDKAWGMYLQMKQASPTLLHFQNTTVGCKEFTPGPGAPRAPGDIANENHMLAALAMKDYHEKNGPACVADFDSYDQGVPLERKSYTPGSGYAQTRAMCLMLAGRCDEGEKLQRAVLAKSNVAPNIIDANIKSVRQSWCKAN